MIEVNNVSFSYGDLQVLDNISFTLQDHESVVILGPSGSGKSTILRLILGLECPQQGEILIDGENICTMKEKQKRLIRKDFGMVFQDGALFDSMTVGENVAYYLMEHSKLSWDEISERAIEMLGFVGLDPKEVTDKLPEQLSGGQRRRVAIGRALLSTNPKIMLYDEPTTGLDPLMNENVLNLMMKLQEQKKVSSIVVTHHIADAFQLADRFIVITEGKIVFDGDFIELKESKNLAVLGFLAPFRIAIADIAKKKFVYGVDSNYNSN